MGVREKRIVSMSQQRQRTYSFLVRLWQEPREVEGEQEAVRGYLRDLQTGEEHYVTDTRAIADFFESSLQEVKRADRAGRSRPAQDDLA
jgi:hypothetical protein